METFKFSSSNDQKVIPCKSQIAKTSKKKKDKNYYQPFISRPVENFYQAPLVQTGSILHQHRPHDHFNSYPPFSSPQPQQQQPPLLPLPLPHTRIRNSDSHPRIRGVSCQPTTNRNYRNDSLIPNKSKPVLPTSPLKLKSTTKDVSDYQVKKIHKSLIKGSSEIKLVKDDAVDVVDDFSGSAAFTLSPPPSSLPLPTFSLRRKLNSCNVEAVGYDAGTTDKLQRLLRLI